MRALILCAGEGRRLGSLKGEQPKPMMVVDGRPILEHNVRMLVRFGVTELAINTHYKPQSITAHFGDGGALGASIRYSYEPELRGTAGAAVPLLDFFDGPFMVLFGDNLTTCDLRRLMGLHRERGASATVALFWRSDPRAGGIAEVDQKPDATQVFSHWVNAGILVAERHVLDYIPRDRPSDWGRDVLPALIAAGEAVRGYRMTERLWWIDTPEDYERTKAEFRGDMLCEI